MKKNKQKLRFVSASEKSALPGAAARRACLFGSAAMLAVAGAWTAAPANAQEPPAGAKESGGLEEIVVTAQRREQKLIDVPISVQVQTGEQLKRQAITDTKQLELVSPSLSFEEAFTSTSASISLRGISSQADSGDVQPSTAVVIDGIPVARSSEFIMDLADIDHIEVLGGPQGTLFGKNATAGVINVVTNKPVPKFEGSLSLGYTTDQEFETQGVLNLPFANNRGAVRFNGFYRDQTPIVKNYAGPDAFGSEDWGGQVKVNYDWTDDFSMLLTAGYSHTDSSYGEELIVTPFSAVPLGPPFPAGSVLNYPALQRAMLGPSFGPGANTITQDAPSQNEMRNLYFASELTWNPTDELTIVSLTGYRKENTYYTQDIDSGPVGIDQGVGFVNLGTSIPSGVPGLGRLYWPVMFASETHNPNPDNWNYVSQELRATYKGDSWTIVGGLYYQYFREQDHNQQKFVYDGFFIGDYTTVPGHSLYLNSFATNSYNHDESEAAFVDATYKLTDTVSMFGGIRQSREYIDLNFASRQTFDFIGFNENGVYNPAGTNVFNPITLALNNPTVTAATAFQTSKVVTNTSGRAGIMWQPTPEQNYYFAFNRGYKGPALNTAYGVNNIQSPAILNPELATAYELGAKLSLLDRRLNINLDLYDQLIQNVQQSAVIPNTPFVSLLNAGDLRARGVEFSMQAAITPEWRFDAQVAYTHSRYESGVFSCNPFQTPGVPPCAANGTQSLKGEPGRDAPDWKFIIGPTYTRPVGEGWKLALNANYSWHSAVQFQLGGNPLTEDSSHGFLNASLNLESEDGWNILIYGKNLTNEFYYSDLNASDYFIASSFGRLSRDYARYGGIKVTRSF